MKDAEKIKEELTAKIEDLRKQLAELEEAKDRPEGVSSALHDPDEVWRLLIEKISDIIMTVDRDGTILSINRTVGEHTVQDTVGTKICDYLSKEAKDTVEKMMEEVFRTGQPVSYEIPGEGSTGRDMAWYETRVLPVKEGDEVIATIHICADISGRKQSEEALRESEARYRTLFEESLDGIVIVDSEARKFKFVNPALCRILGYTEKELVGMDITDIHPDHSVEVVMSEFDALTREEKVLLRDLPFECKDGTVMYFNVSATTAEINGEKSTVGFFRDVTERKLAEDELKLREQHYRKLWDEAPVAYHILDTEGIVTSVNRTEANMLGYEPEEMIGKSIFEFLASDEREEAERWFRMKIAGHRFPKGHDRAYVRKDGSNIHVSIDDVLEYDRHGDVTGIRTTLLDVTERKKADETIRRLAYYDALTDLPNRTLFGMRLATALVHAYRAGGKLAVMLLDLDHFKNINDSLGHKVGDELLKEISNRLAAVVRGGDTVARMGGDEFLVVAPEVHDESGAIDVAERILEAIRKPVTCRSQILKVTASIGIALYPRDGTENGALIRNADIAMYRAKSAGRNNFKTYLPDK